MLTPPWLWDVLFLNSPFMSPLLPIVELQKLAMAPAASEKNKYWVILPTFNER